MSGFAGRSSFGAFAISYLTNKPTAGLAGFAATPLQHNLKNNLVPVAGFGKFFYRLIFWALPARFRAGAGPVRYALRPGAARTGVRMAVAAARPRSEGARAGSFRAREKWVARWGFVHRKREGGRFIGMEEPKRPRSREMHPRVLLAKHKVPAGVLWRAAYWAGAGAFCCFWAACLSSSVTSLASFFCWSLRLGLLAILSRAAKASG